MSSYFSFLDEDDIGITSPAFQPRVYVVMRLSPKMGGTYSEIRKSLQGVKRLLDEWDFLGIDMKNVRVCPIEKEWVPIRKTKIKQDKGDF